MGRRAALLCSFLLAALLPGAARAAEPAAPARPEVREIVIEGARMVEEATVRSRITTREGAPYDPEQVSRDVRAIWDLGSFEDVRVDADSFEGGLRLTFRLRERPLLRNVVYEGNKEVKTDDLREKADLSGNAVYNPVRVAAAVERIRAIYREKGYYNAAVRTRTEPAGEGRVDLFVTIDEGQVYRLVKISFTGNEAFPDEELRDQMKTDTWGFFSRWTSSGKLRQDLIQEDRQSIVTFYQDHGYLEVRVGEPEITVDDAQHRIEVVLPVTEGAQYRLGEIALRGDDLVPLEEIRALVKIAPGDVFRRSAFAKGLFDLSQRYASRGYAFVKVDYQTRLNDADRTIDVTFLVEKGPVARFGRVTISGNTTTRDKVIRRELTFAEGDVFSSEALRRSRQKVMNLGFFDAVDLQPRPRGEDVIDVEIAVKERLTGMVSFGVGYSSEDKLTGQVRFTESNLLGYGQSLTLMAEYSPVRRNYSLSFSDPAVFDSRWSFGFSIYDTLRDYDEYDRKAIGQKITLGRSLGEFVRGFVSLKHETVSVSDIQDTASNYIREQEGTSTTNSVRLALVRDTRDNYFNPTDGLRTSVSYEVAGGPFGGSNDFTKLELEQSVYTPLVWKLVGLVHGQYGEVKGYNGMEPPIYEKYFLGGIMSLRGFPFREVGPVDDLGEPKGGYKELFFNTELIVPIAPEQGFNFVLFYDTGNAWDKGESIALSDFRESAGFGLRWMSPIGPFRLEWGWILDRREGEPKGDWSFIIGNFF